MLCCLRLALSSFIAAQSLSGSWVVFAVSWEGTWDSGLELETMGKGGLGFGAKVVMVGFVCTMAEIGCNWARIGPSKSSQSLSIAHKWAVVID
ncbi:hypothetical protein Tco_1159027 [Tanacetum coccineum]